MRHRRLASVMLVLRAALFVPIVGCGVVASTNAPQPVDSDPSSTSVPVAPSGLQLGYVWQKDSHNLYPVLGVAGSARFGDGLLPTDVPVIAAGAAQAPNASWVIVLSQDGTVEETQLPTGSTSMLAAHIPLDSTLVFSPAGTAAALGSPSAQSVVVISGLPSKAQIAVLQLPAGALSGIAVSDAGTVIAGVKQAGSPGTQLLVVSGTHSAALLGNVKGWGGAAFVPASVTGSGSEAAVFADSTSARVTSVSNLGGAAPAISALADGGLLQAPNALGVSADGKWAYVTDGGKPQVVRLSLAATAPAASAIACACSPQQMVPLTTDGIYGLTSSGAGQPNWILDTRTAQPRTFFVPGLPVRASAAQATAQGSKRGASVRAGGSR
jgi:hypothetical protein